MHRIVLQIVQFLTSCILSLQIDSNFTIPCLEEAVITIRSPLNAEQKISTLESIVKYAGNLKKLVLKILQMKSCHNGTDDFFEDVWKFTHIHRKIARIE